MDRYDEALDAPEAGRRLAARSLQMLVAIVPAARATFCPVNEHGEIAAGVMAVQTTPSGRPFEQARREYALHYAEQDPFAPARHAADRRGVLSVGDVGGAHAFARTPYGGEYMPGQGFDDQVTLYLRDAGRILASIALTRGRGTRRFDPHELGLLRRVVPALEVGYACASGPTVAAGPDDVLAARGLTPRECDVAKLAATGATNAQIARALRLSDATVKTHLGRVYQKLGLRGRTRLAALLAAGRSAGVRSRRPRARRAPRRSAVPRAVPSSGPRGGRRRRAAAGRAPSRPTDGARRPGRR
jgi:DNA-binding CsgD family transcriptional regulator